MKYDPQKYSDLDFSYKMCNSHSKEISDYLILLGFDYVNKILGSINNDRFYQIRDSINLRINSVLFHYHILEQIHNPKKKIITQNYSPLHSISISSQQSFLFDSIIFNTISVFDYLSCLITLVEKKNKDDWRRTWTSLCKSARGTADFKDSKIALRISKLDHEWVGKLNDYRAELIHYDTSGLPASQTYNVMQNSLEIHVSMPRTLKKYFRELKNLPEKADLNINSISIWIIENSLLIVKELLDELKQRIKE
jgi:hypothetical protein